MVVRIVLIDRHWCQVRLEFYLCTKSILSCTVWRAMQHKYWLWSTNWGSVCMSARMLFIRPGYRSAGPPVRLLSTYYQSKLIRSASVMLDRRIQRIVYAFQMCPDLLMLFLLHKRVTWSCCRYGQLGQSKITAIVEEPVKIPSLENVMQLACGRRHTVALVQNAISPQLLSFGAGDEGQQGTGSLQKNLSPVPVKGASLFIGLFLLMQDSQD